MRCSSDGQHAWQREAIHQQYTGVLTLLQGTTGFNHTPSWSKIGSHLDVIFITYGEGMAVVMDMHGHVRLYTSSTQVCLLYFRVPLILTTPLPGVR